MERMSFVLCRRVSKLVRVGEVLCLRRDDSVGLVPEGFHVFVLHHVEGELHPETVSEEVSGSGYPKRVDLLSDGQADRNGA